MALLIDISRRTIIGALGHDDVITDVAMDDNATYAITGTRSGTVSLWSLGDGSLVEQQQYQNPIVYTTISPDGTSFISAAATGPVVLTQLNQTVGQQTLFKGNPGIISANFSAQNRLLLGSSREKVWEFDMTTGAKLKTWQVPRQGPWHKAAIMSLHKDSDGVQAIASDGIAYQLH